MTKKLSELYAPKPQGEKDFVAKHKGGATLKKSKPTQNDDQFNSGKVKTFDRSAKRMGYDAGDDEKAYGVGGKNPGPNDQNKEVGIAPYTIKTNEGEEIELTQDDIDDLLDMLGDIILNEAHGYKDNETAKRMKLGLSKGGLSLKQRYGAEMDKRNSGYNKDSVDKAIKNNRTGKIGGKEAKAIHGLLKGWRGK